MASARLISSRAATSVAATRAQALIGSAATAGVLDPTDDIRMESDSEGTLQPSHIMDDWGGLTNGTPRGCQ